MRGFTHCGVALEICRLCGGGLLTPDGLTDLVRDRSDPGAWVEAGVATRLRESTRRCPAHSERPPMELYRLAHGVEDVEVDLCSECGSLWLDAGEGRDIEAIADSLHTAQNTVLVSATDLEEAQAADTRLIGYLTDRRHAAWPATMIGFAVFVAIMAHGYFVPLEDYLAAWAFMPVELYRGLRPEAVISSAFAHLNVLHLLMNAIWFIPLGRRIEQYLGSLFVTALFICSAVAGKLAFFAVDPTSATYSLGSSGGIAGFFGALLIIAPQIRLVQNATQHAQLKWALGVWVCAQTVLGVIQAPGINFAAHVGGFVGGALFAVILRALGLTKVKELSWQALEPGTVGKALSKLGDMIIEHPLLSIPLAGVVMMGGYALFLGLLMVGPGSGSATEPGEIDWARSFDDAMARHEAFEDRVASWTTRYRGPAERDPRGVGVTLRYLVVDEETGFVMDVRRSHTGITSTCVGRLSGAELQLRFWPRDWDSTEPRAAPQRRHLDQFRNSAGETIFSDYDVTLVESIPTAGCPKDRYDM